MKRVKLASVADAAVLIGFFVGAGAFGAYVASGDLGALGVCAVAFAATFICGAIGMVAEAESDMADVLRALDEPPVQRAKRGFGAGIIRMESARRARRDYAAVARLRKIGGL